MLHPYNKNYSSKFRNLAVKGPVRNVKGPVRDGNNINIVLKVGINITLDEKRLIRYPSI